jgi:thioredoxin 1
VREITDASFQADVLKAGKPVVVDFWAPWCGPCKAVAPILESLAADHAGRVEFAKINIDDNPEAASRYDVLSIPTTILFEGGQPRQTVIGARPRSYYEQAFEDWLN